MRIVLRVVLVLVCVLLAVATAANVYGDDDAERAKADALACGDKHCPDGTVVDLEKTVLGKAFDYQMHGRTLRVRCSRSALVFGPWQCALDVSEP